MAVFKPFALSKKDDLPEAIPQWKADISALGLPEDKKFRLIELLKYALVQRFSELTVDEVNAMLRLTPLEQTVAGKQIHRKRTESHVEAVGDGIGNVFEI